MDHLPITAEEMAALHPGLFRVSQPKPAATFAELQAAALAALSSSRCLPAARPLAARSNCTDNASNA